MTAAIPSFVASIVLILLFAVKLGWFPALGTGADFVSTCGTSPCPPSRSRSRSLAIVARVTRAAIREEATASTCRPRSAAASRRAR